MHSFREDHPCIATDPELWSIESIVLGTLVAILAVGAALFREISSLPIADSTDQPNAAETTRFASSRSKPRLTPWRIVVQVPGSVRGGNDQGHQCGSAQQTTCQECVPLLRFGFLLPPGFEPHLIV